jgi:lipopolysaccharide transport system permease protein
LTRLRPASPEAVRIRAGRLFPDRPFRSLWDARELMLVLARRDVHLRYQHSVAGIGWAILQPMLTVVVLSAFQFLMGHRSASGLPYPLYAVTALVPWTFLAHALTQSSHCLPRHASIINKVYFPRLIFPLSAVMGAAADFAVGMALPPALMIYYGVPPGASLLALPLFIVQVVALAAAAGIWLAWLNAHFRDTANSLPFLTQLWFFLTPIAYTADIVPPQWQLITGLNPMVGILEGFRWALFGSASPLLTAQVAMSWLVILTLLSSGILVFLRGEESLADVL